MEDINRKEIEQKILRIINDILANDSDLPLDELSVSDKLNIIISESRQALEFVTTIEDEFDIELDDDDVDLDFFTRQEVMLERITNKVEKLI